jgi:phosphomannomutase/phosphoglucomutase
MSSHIFREYDIRGVADRDLTDSVVDSIGAGLAHMIPGKPPEKPTIVVCRDCRHSGPRLFDALTGGLRRAGANVVDVGVGPTPLMYFAVHHLNADGGVMITGSHNPKDENGLKIMTGKASFFGEEIQELARRVQAGGFEDADAPGGLDQQDLSDAYLASVVGGIRIQNTDVRFVVDAGNGAAGPLGLAALRRVGLNPTSLFCDMDGDFPNHHPDPADEESLETLIATVKKADAVVGLAWDGDGDRLGVVDKTGKIVWGDRLLALFARYALANHPGGKVIGDVKCSQALFDDIEKHGGSAIMGRTGHSLIKSLMKKEQALLAGEMSGHFFFADRYFGFDDGIYAALRVMEIVASEGRTVVDLLADLPEPFATPELRVPCPDHVKFDVVAQVKRHFEGQAARIIDIDGVRFVYPDSSWGLVRASNTGPMLVLRFEAPTAERLEQIRSATEAVIAATRATLNHS